MVNEYKEIENDNNRNNMVRLRLNELRNKINELENRVSELDINLQNSYIKIDELMKINEYLKIQLTRRRD